MLDSGLLNFLVVVLFLGTLALIFWPVSHQKYLKKLTLWFSFFVFFCSLFLLVTFNRSSIKFQFITEFSWLSFLGTNCAFGVDGISLFFVLLTTFLFPICLLSGWRTAPIRLKEYLICIFLIETFLVCVFCVLDLLLFYIFFEGILIPMFFLIGIWGSRERKIKASYLLFLYTLFGSFFMLLGIIYIFLKTGTTNYEILAATHFSLLEQKFLWLSFFASFATKIPMFPMHIWLPEAHVEAPTLGSIILAGILLKLGTYGLLRFSLPLFPEASYYYSPLVFTLSVLSVVYASFTAIRQTNLKRVIAYSSVAHMNLVVVGLFSGTLSGLEGAILQSISHGFVSSALFLIIGILYDRYKTKLIKYYSGLAHVMPLTMFILLFFVMAGVGLPGTSSFIGEFLILAGLFKVSLIVVFLGVLSLVLGSVYSLWLYNRISYGNLKTQYAEFSFFDIEKNEFYSVVPLIAGTLLVGILPEFLLETLHATVANYPINF